MELVGVVLCITGTEAIFADLGHFSVRAVQPTFVVAIAASIIASQAMISGSFTIISQALSLGCFPRSLLPFEPLKKLGMHTGYCCGCSDGHHNTLNFSHNANNMEDKRLKDNIVLHGLIQICTRWISSSGLFILPNDDDGYLALCIPKEIYV
ncbi:hypothetical protein GIB67_011082 [Kingdonia uniflora]|uniref:K+ potassium transporter integral membrane domain-containing protein n=1 Tax=Kingdonia uniflora TaxID=39325 RepID=A0A7J7LKG7_9MAGN|nr:hypothetical protein GIB67_011082 [Kingdonia uniflora]